MLMQSERVFMSVHVIRIIQRSEKDSAGYSVIVCEVEGVHKYVTWLCDAEGNKHYGDYCATFEKAMQSYFERCEENGVAA